LSGPPSSLSGRAWTRTRTARGFLTRIAQPHELLEEGSPGANALLAAHGATGAATPALIDGHEVLAAVSVASLADAWRLSAPPSRAHYDFAIVAPDRQAWRQPSTTHLTACRPC
jgi:hypothetical protein